MKRNIILTIWLAGASAAVYAQGQGGIHSDVIKTGEKPSIAVPDFRGSGDAQKFMGVFNTTLFNDLSGSGQLKMIPKTLYPVQAPQQPSDFKPPVNGQSQGLWLTDWSGPPPNANYLAFGYTAAQSNQIVLYGFLYDVHQANPGSAQLIGKSILARWMKRARARWRRNSRPTS